ncbi:hypothetical protein ACFOPX_05810 [Helicobacter baculiformis]|uniref:Uncharacterized protein n=1 Tax=Helicobacter baculiformis TaxID=427351 RepID=A0ABV7ZLK5_9HELI|nr:hypothetical protein [Helicobacter baculiformis]
MGAWIVLGLVLLLLWLLLKDFGLVRFKQKFISAGILLLLGGVVGFYTYEQDRTNRTQMDLQRAFLRGETLLCSNHVEVNNKNFNLVTGTLSFLGKPNGPMKDTLIDLQSCQKKTP